jgi:hypothetical protein
MYNKIKGGGNVQEGLTHGLAQPERELQIVTQRICPYIPKSQLLSQSYKKH